MLRVEGLSVRYGDHVAVDDVHLEAEDGEVVCVLGPSGCGKTSLLRVIAGLERPTAGRVLLDGTDVTTARPDQRHVGLMFQQHALFPHKSVAENVAFGPRVRGWSRDEVAAVVDRALGLVDLAGFGPREVATLSGGEQQRVALARAIAPAPRLLMLDEPLGSLDRRLRDDLVDELREVFDELGTTVLYVTHDQQEALALADRIVVMRTGRFERSGTPEAVWRDPRHEFVARFLGHEHVLDAVVRDGVAHTGLGRLPLEGAADGAVRLVLLPEAIELVEAASPPPTGVLVRGEVLDRRFAGDHLLARVRCDALVLGVAIRRGTGPSPGDEVLLRIDPAAVRVVLPDTPTDA